MNFIGATRKQAGKIINDDAFTVFNGTFAFLLDGAGNARGATKRCVDIIRGQYQQNLMPSFPYLINLLNMNLTGLDAESTLVGVEIKQGDFLTGVSCGDSPLYVIREFRANSMTDAKSVSSVVEKFREKYGTKDVKKYYSKFDVAVVVVELT
jgi:hypothetical protein